MNKYSFVDRVLRRVAWAICRFLPIQRNKVTCSSYYGCGYSDNLKYIVDELIKRKGIKIVWFVKGEREAATLPKNVIPCKVNSISSIYHSTTAAVWIDNCRKSVRYKKRSQLYIQTWHGGGAGKKCEKDVVDSLAPGYEAMAIKDAANTDIMIASDKYMASIYHRAFWYDGHVAEIGYPRYVVFFQKNNKLMKKKVFDFFGISDDKSIVLYAPTFRSNNETKAYDIDHGRAVKALSAKFQKKFVFVVHLHPNIAYNCNVFSYDEINIINGTNYPDMQELLVASDVLIGDYSSVNYDFALMEKPVFRYASDVDEYKEDRDMYFKIDEYPFPLAENNDELEKTIIDFDPQKYCSELKAFHDRIGTIRNPYAAKRCADYVSDYIESGLNKSFIFKKYSSDFDC